MAYAILIVVLGSLLGPALVGRDRLGFRDTSHFYTPLYEYVAARQGEAWVPLWNPQDMSGLPLVGETSTAVFYPPRMLVYALITSPESAMAWYAALHLLWAAIAIHIAARVSGASSLGCAIAILGYPLAGPILFNIHNVPFLVGASWLPLALAGAVRLMHQNHPRWIAATAIAFALPTLGGDPQTTVHALLLVVSLMVWRGFGDYLYPERRQRARYLGLSAAILLSGLIAAPQLAASIDWARQTPRLTSDASTDRYDFSVPPWHWTELLIPEASGRLFPTYTRLSQAIPGDGRMWVATLYSGLVPLMFAVHRFRTAGRRLDFWDVLLPLGLLFAMAGPFWLLASVIPGYSSFRYPAKWLPLVPLGLSIMAARQTRQIVTDDLRSMRWACVGIGWFTLCAAGMAVVAGSSETVVNALEALSLHDVYWGPLAVPLAFEQLTWSALGIAVLSCLLWLCLRRIRLLGLWILMLVAIDLYVAARPQIAMVNRRDEASLIGQPVLASGSRAMRVSKGQPWPQSWSATQGGQQRLLEVAASERGTSFGRWHLSNAGPVFNTATTLQPERIQAFWTAIDGMNLRHRAEDFESWHRMEAWLGVTHRRIVTARSRMRGQPALATVHLEPHSFSSPLVRWDNAWKPIARPEVVTAEMMAARLAEVVSEPGPGAPLVESDSPAGESGGLGAAQIDVVSVNPERVRLQITAQRPGLLTIKSFQDGHWHAEIAPLDQADTDPQAGADARVAEVFPVDFLFMGTFVPSGKVQVTFRYQPWWLAPSIALAASGCLIAILLVLVGGPSPQPLSQSPWVFTLPPRGRVGRGSGRGGPGAPSPRLRLDSPGGRVKCGSCF